ncbi:hypothetical protein PN499_23350 [Kamptonema animale CS-326]|jgi:hypothetical protein|uniref:hypothetical protein n=1 Tax=Kamptonema animale TaxID=92934 RepID=UPI00232EB6D8|nr:hypothetical protein [Kamptonema animale]MDB9514142.1 hypothetical protein [Kamptonema animale CS-326]
MIAFTLSLLLSTSVISDSAQRTVDYLEGTVKPVIEHAMEWGAKAALALTGTHAFIVVVKRFLD